MTPRRSRGGGDAALAAAAKAAEERARALERELRLAQRKSKTTPTPKKKGRPSKTPVAEVTSPLNKKRPPPPLDAEAASAMVMTKRPRKRASRGTGSPRTPTPAAQEKWNMQVDKLMAFKEEHGHTDVPVKYPEDQSFSNWCRMQRDKYNYPNRGYLPEERIAQLEELGFDWKTPKNSVPPKPFEELLDEAKKHHAEHGNLNIPRRLALGNWLHRQREKYADQKLDQEKIDALEALGMDWTLAASAGVGKPPKTFNEYLGELQAFKSENNHVNVPKSKGLGQWLVKQKELYHEQKLEAEQFAALDQLGVDWTLPPRKKAWEEQLAVLVAYHVTHGNIHVSSTDQENASLRNWMRTQKEYYHKGKLTQDQISQLQSLGFDFELPPKRKSWEEFLKDLSDYKDMHATTAVPDNHDDPNLPKWINRQRNQYHKQKLSADQIQKLQALGFDWTQPTKGDKWADMFDKLTEYSNNHGDINGVSMSYKEEPNLCHWVCRQRALNAKGKLSPEQVEKLTVMGIDWTGPQRYKPTTDEAWQAHFELIKEFQQKNGHCGVPTNFPEDLSLLEWIHKQHVAYLKKDLSQERIDMLESIGFAWRDDICLLYTSPSPRD